MNMNRMHSLSFDMSCATVARFCCEDVDMVYAVTFVPEVEGFISAHVYHGDEADVIANQATDVRFDCWGVKADGRAWGHTS